MNNTIIDILSLDTVFLSYDEPNREENWAKLLDIQPNAKRVDRVNGLATAHRAAAQASSTDRYLLVTGDTVPDKSFFEQQLVLNEDNINHVFIWKTRNNINGLTYNNSGLSCRIKESIKPQEIANYKDMYDCYSTHCISATAFQAWSTGFKQAVNLSLDNGQRPTVDKFKQQISQKNLDDLSVWHNVGRDVDNGIWSMLGARMATYMLMITPTWDYQEAEDAESLKNLWLNIDGHDPEHILGRIAPDLINQLNLPIVMLDEKASGFFKNYYRQTRVNKGIMLTEADVI